MSDLKNVKGGGQFTMQVNEKKTCIFAFQIHDGKFILCQMQETIKGLEDSEYMQKFLDHKQIEMLNLKWSHFQDYEKRIEYDIYLKYRESNIFDILHLQVSYNKEKYPVPEPDTILIISPTIDRFYFDTRNLVAFQKIDDRCEPNEYDFQDFRQKRFSLELPTESGIKKTIHFGFSFRVCAIEHYSRINDHADSVQISAPFCFFTEGDSRFDLEDIEKLITLVNNFLSFVCFEPTKDITEMLLSYETPEGRMLPGFYTTNNVEQKAAKRMIINFSDLQDNGTQALMQNLLDGMIDISLILPLEKDRINAVDLLRYCAAIEYELRANSDYKKISDRIRTEIKYDELHAFFLNHKELVLKDQRSEFDAAIGVFEKFDGSLKNKLKFTHEKLLSFFDREHLSWTYPFQINEICTRVKDFRNGLGHGLREDKHLRWYPCDIQLLQAMVYILILTRIGVNEDGIRYILGKISSNLNDLLLGRRKKKVKEKTDRH